MAGYIGSKTSVTQVDGYNRTEADAEFVNDPNSVISVSGSNVGIGTSSSSADLEIASDNPKIQLTDTDDSGYSQIRHNTGSLIFEADKGNTTASSAIRFDLDSSEAMRLDSSSNLLVSVTTTSGFQSSSSESGTIAYAAGGIASNSPSNDVAGVFNRLGTDGIIVQLKKDGSTVGGIGTALGYPYLGALGAGGRGVKVTGAFEPATNAGANNDNAMDIGTGSVRWDDIYATNGTIQTSDRNEKQDIEALSDAEQRVAVACKGLLRKFRWIDAVAEKGDDARIHFGIIAQDLQDAFAAEGLDAGRYAMFISSTWWETQTEVPAVEAVAEVLDEDGNVVTEAVEAKEAYTRTDTYETLEEAPEGATERTRLGVRYPELLAFIIGAM